MYDVEMEKEPTLTEMLFGDVRASKLQELAERARKKGLPALLIDPESDIKTLITGVPERDDIID